MPVNDSRASAASLQEAVRLAREQGSRMRLIHWIDVGLAEVLAHSVGAMLDEARMLAENHGARVEDAVYRFATGHAADVILAEIENWQPDLVVMGTSGRRGLSRVLRESDAELVVRIARVPVLVVHS